MERGHETRAVESDSLGVRHTHLTPSHSQDLLSFWKIVITHISLIMDSLLFFLSPRLRALCNSFDSKMLLTPFALIAIFTIYYMEVACPLCVAKAGL